MKLKSMYLSFVIFTQCLSFSLFSLEESNPDSSFFNSNLETLSFRKHFHNRQNDSTNFVFTFSKNNNDWQGEFADYFVDEEVFFELAWGWDTLPPTSFPPTPPPLKPFTKGLFLQGNNHSDDLFMFVKRQVGGLRPNTWYGLTFEVIIENNIPPGQSGVGGSPGESVYFKVGAASIEPEKIAQPDGIYRLNVDIGYQAEGGKNAIVVGNLANPLVNENDPQYEPKTYVNEAPLLAKTDSNGRLWLFVGTDSAFEGLTFYYIAKIAVKAQRDRHCHRFFGETSCITYNDPNSSL